jgi:hypothetical protein
MVLVYRWSVGEYIQDVLTEQGKKKDSTRSGVWKQGGMGIEGRKRAS